MADVDERTRFRFSAPQLCTIIGAIVACTWLVNNTLQQLRFDIRSASQKAEAAWTIDDQTRWVWLANRNNPKFTLPYPIELRSSTP